MPLYNHGEPSQPDEVGVHKLGPDWTQNLVAAVLHQAQLPSIKDHAHLKTQRAAQWMQAVVLHTTEP